MTVPFPTPQWPSGLLESGPEEDPDILLRSMAEIAGAPYAVVAIRIDPIDMRPDFRGDVPARAYRDHRLSDIVEALAGFVDISDRALVALPSGRYVLLMVPADAE